MKALYLDGRRETIVRLDGPALRVQTAGRADGRYPLGRVARIVTIGNIAWHPQALLACLHFAIPVAMLDGRGRFVRLRFVAQGQAVGLARHLGELLAVERYRQRFEHWRRAAERRARAEVLAAYGVRDRHDDSGAAWQALLCAQSRAARRRPGRFYTALTGFTMAQLTSGFARIGLPADPALWSRSEYRLVRTFAALECWRHVAVVDLLLRRGGQFDRSSLIVAFEQQAAAREERFVRWRQELLLALLGISLPGYPDNAETNRAVSADVAARTAHWIRDACAAACHAVGNASRLPCPPRDSLRSSAKILRTWLQYDRGRHELL